MKNAMFFIYKRIAQVDCSYLLKRLLTNIELCCTVYQYHCSITVQKHDTDIVEYRSTVSYDTTDFSPTDLNNLLAPVIKYLPSLVYKLSWIEATASSLLYRHVNNIHFTSCTYHVWQLESASLIPYQPSLTCFSPSTPLVCLFLCQLKYIWPWWQPGMQTQTSLLLDLLHWNSAQRAMLMHCVISLPVIPKSTYQSE
jgi:hypothetical protein